MSDGKKKGFLKEFQEFASRGNVMDMAVGVIIATAFGKITTSLVNDVFMPLFGFIFGSMDFAKLNITLRQAVTEVLADGTVNTITPAVTMGIGSFLAAIVDFILIAFAVFLVVKFMNRAREKAEALKKAKAVEEAAAQEAAPEAPAADILLLTEIRDLLKDGKHG